MVDAPLILIRALLLVLLNVFHVNHGTSQFLLSYVSLYVSYISEEVGEPIDLYSMLRRH